MGKGVVTSVLGSGRYNVNITREETHLNWLIDEYQQRNSDLTNTHLPNALSTLEAEEETLNTYLGELNSALTTYESAYIQWYVYQSDENEQAKDEAYDAALVASETYLNQGVVVTEAAYVYNTLQDEFLYNDRFISDLQSRKESQQENRAVWCIDLCDGDKGYEALSVDDEVTLWEIDRTGEEIVIKSTYPNGISEYDELATLQTFAAATSPAGWAYNIAAYPGLMKWNPWYSKGVIQSVDYKNNKCSVVRQLTSASQNIMPEGHSWDDDTVYGEQFDNVPIIYMECDAAPFVVGDVVMMGFNANREPSVLGFMSNPKPCGPNVPIQIYNVTQHDFFTLYIAADNKWYRREDNVSQYCGSAHWNRVSDGRTYSCSSYKTLLADSRPATYDLPTAGMVFKDGGEFQQMPFHTGGLRWNPMAACEDSSGIAWIAAEFINTGGVTERAIFKKESGQALVEFWSETGQGGFGWECCFNQAGTVLYVLSPEDGFKTFTIGASSVTKGTSGSGGSVTSDDCSVLYTRFSESFSGPSSSCSTSGHENENWTWDQKVDRGSSNTALRMQVNPRTGDISLVRGGTVDFKQIKMDTDEYPSATASHTKNKTEERDFQAWGGPSGSNSSWFKANSWGGLGGTPYRTEVTGSIELDQKSYVYSDLWSEHSGLVSVSGNGQGYSQLLLGDSPIGDKVDISINTESLEMNDSVNCSFCAGYSTPYTGTGGNIAFSTTPYVLRMPSGNYVALAKINGTMVADIGGGASGASVSTLIPEVAAGDTLILVGFTDGWFI